MELLFFSLGIVLFFAFFIVFMNGDGPFVALILFVLSCGCFYQFSQFLDEDPINQWQIEKIKKTYDKPMYKECNQFVQGDIVINKQFHEYEECISHINKVNEYKEMRGEAPAAAKP